MSWASCSKTCGGGSQYQKRNCDNPAPSPDGGADCRGEPTRQRSCKNNKCKLVDLVTDHGDKMFSLQVQLMVPGEAGDPGQSVPRPVVEEQSPGGDCVTVQSRPMVAETVVVITLNRNGATVTPVRS